MTNVFCRINTKQVIIDNYFKFMYLVKLRGEEALESLVGETLYPPK